jgi:phosphate transport system substrate-binding protein
MRKTVIMAALTLLTASVGLADALQLEGSTTVGPIADAFAEYFKSIYPDLNITVKKTGSGDGAAALLDGRCDIANMSRFMKDKEFAQAVANGVFPVAHVVAMDGVCVVVHPSNPVKALTRAQVRDIYTGKIKNWNQVGGANMPIVVISRDTSSGTYETFHNLVVEKQQMAGNVEYVNANPQAHARVKTSLPTTITPPYELALVRMPLQQ